MAVVYTEILKNTPLLVVLFVIYFGLPTIHVVLSPLIAGSLALTVCYAAYLSEIFRAGLQGVPNGQREAGYAVGLSTVAIYWNIICNSRIGSTGIMEEPRNWTPTWRRLAKCLGLQCTN